MSELDITQDEADDLRELVEELEDLEEWKGARRVLGLLRRVLAVSPPPNPQGMRTEVPPRSETVLKIEVLENAFATFSLWMAQALGVSVTIAPDAAPAAVVRAAQDTVSRLEALRRHGRKCPIGYHDERLLRHHSTTDADVIAWIAELKRLVEGGDAES